MRIPAIALSLLLIVAPVYAVEGIPDWHAVLDGVMQRAALVPQSAPLPQPAAPAKSVHPAVSEFLRYYQTRGAATFANAVQRLTPLRPHIEQVFQQEGVPAELLWLGLVESGYQSNARSPKEAVGVWQFVPETARQFGLRVDAAIDDRTDTPKATRAAARYLRHLYSLFGDWRLALAAYNAGEGRVQQAIRQAGGVRDFWAASAYLPRETQAYVPAVLAAQIIGGGDQIPPPAAPVAKVLTAPFTLTPD